MLTGVAVGGDGNPDVPWDGEEGYRFGLWVDIDDHHRIGQISAVVVAATVAQEGDVEGLFVLEVVSNFLGYRVVAVGFDED